jgi:hypothetical protein
MIIVTGLAILVLFAVAAILVKPNDGNLERRLPRDPIDDLPIWALLGRR